jgi:hypothetical protein
MSDRQIASGILKRGNGVGRPEGHERDQPIRTWRGLWARPFRKERLKVEIENGWVGSPQKRRHAHEDPDEIRRRENEVGGGSSVTGKERERQRGIEAANES